jgi:hypothetical protein
MGGSVYISGSPSAAEATCRMGSSVLIPTGVSLLATPGTVRLKPTTGNTDSVVLLNLSGHSNIYVSSITIDGGGKDFGTANNVVELFGGDNNVFDHVNFEHTRGIAVLASTGITNSGVQNSHFTDIGNHWKTTLVSTDRQQAIAFCCGLTENSYGNFAVKNTFTDIGLDPISTGNQKDFLVAHNKCDMENNQITLLPTGTYGGCFYSTDNDSVTVIGNIVDGAQGNGIDIINTTNATVIGNQVNNGGDCGIGIFDNTSATVVGNTTRNNGQWSSASAANGGAGICFNNAGIGKRLIANGNISTDDQAAISTTCSGTVGVGATSCTAVSIVGMKVNDKIKIAGAGVAAADLTTKLSGISGTTTITWRTATSTSTTNAVVTGVATQTYGIYGKAGSTYTDLEIGTNNSLSGNVTGNFGGVLKGPVTSNSSTVLGSNNSSVVMGDSGTFGYVAMKFNSSATFNLANSNLYGSNADNDFFINRPTGGVIHIRENNGTDQLTVAAGGAVTAAGGFLLPGITSDATHTDTSVCQDTTTHQLYAGSGAAGICLGTSSARFKLSIAPQTDGLAEVLKLRPVNFRYRPGYGDGGGREQYGFIAEDVAKVMPKLVGLDSEGNPQSLDYMALVPVLVKAVQEQQREIEALKRRLP